MVAAVSTAVPLKRIGPRAIVTLCKDVALCLYLPQRQRRDTVNGKGSKRVRARSPGLYRDNYDRTFAPWSEGEEVEALECPTCGQIDLIPQVDNPPMWECRHCKIEVQF